MTKTVPGVPLGIDEDTNIGLDDPTLEPHTGMTAAATTPTLRQTFSGSAGIMFQDHPVKRGTIDVGRAVMGPGDLRLDHDSRTSRQHCTFVRDERSRRVRVINRSQNGTWLNDQKVEDAVLQDGDVVRVGDTFFVFRLMPDVARDAKIERLAGRAPSIGAVRALIQAVGPTGASCVLLGETGAGKEVVARSIHEASGRTGPFVAVNCAAIPETLAESQLFGHKAGSFTGARGDHPGFFRQAEGGTLFLDEVGELVPALQPKLLRVLDEHIVTPVGSTSGTPVDVRVIAATNRDLATEVEKGTFRADLFARLAELTVFIPPLRSRREDILVLLQTALGPDPQQVTPRLVHALLLYMWPFNVRELFKVATELKVKGAGQPLLDLDLLEGRLTKKAPVEGSPGFAPTTMHHPGGGVVSQPQQASPMPAPPKTKAEDLPVPTKEELERLLQAHRGRVADVARATGRSRTQVYRWLEQHGLSIDTFRK